MSTITRDQLRERAREKVKSLEFAVTQTAFADTRAELEGELELARIALASLEQFAEFMAAESIKSGDYPDGWQFKASNAAHEYAQNIRAAMLQGAGVTEKCRSSENVQEVQEYPETLPCPVFLEPGLRFGKGVPTRTMLGALRRRSEYYSELEAMTPDERAEHDAGMKEFAAMLQGADVMIVKPLSITLPDISSKAFRSGTGKDETFHPETYRRWVKEAIERACTIARIDVEVK